MIRTIGKIQRLIEQSELLQIADWKSYRDQDDRLVAASLSSYAAGRDPVREGHFDLELDGLTSIHLRWYSPAILVFAHEEHREIAKSEADHIAESLHAEFIPVSRRFMELEEIVEQFEGFISMIETAKEIQFGELCHISPLTATALSGAESDGQIYFFSVDLKMKQWKEGLCVSRISDLKAITKTDIFSEEIGSAAPSR